MVLDVVLYTDAEVHTCSCLKRAEDIVAYWKNDHTCMTSNLHEIKEPLRDKFTNVTFEQYDALSAAKNCPDCPANGRNLLTLGVDYLSHYDRDSDFLPGKVIKYQDCLGFSFGTVWKCLNIRFRLRDYCETNAINNVIGSISDKPGYYTGSFLYCLKKQLELVSHLDPKLSEYREMLEAVPVDMLTKCVVVHC